MEKIEVIKGVQGKIAKALGVSPNTVSSALRFRYNSEKENWIRREALLNWGGKVVDIPTVPLKRIEVTKGDICKIAEALKVDRNTVSSALSFVRNTEKENMIRKEALLNWGGRLIQEQELKHEFTSI